MLITQAEKEKFLADMSEADFRERVIRRLFKTIGFKDGRDLCGPEEFGKDAVFIDTDRFGDESVIAIQTKTGSVTMAGDPSKNLHVILAQLRTALDHPHICVRTKTKKLPSIVYLAASGVINANARAYLEREISNPRLKFLDRDDLITKVDENCPEIWSGVIAQVSPYLKSLADRVDELSVSLNDNNHAQSTFGAFAAASDNTFVDPVLAYQEVKLERRNGRVFEDISFVDVRGSQLFRSSGIRALILGDAGSGKTTLMIRLAYSLAKSANISRKIYRVPIFARAFEFVGANGSSFQILSDLVIRNHSLQALPFSFEDMEAGRVVLLVDGLDELSEDHDRQSVIDFCLRFVDEHPKCSMALTTRPYSSVDRLDGLNRFRRYRIAPLSIEDASKMLTNLDSKKDQDANSEWRRETLRKLEGVHGVELNPLLVTVFAVSSKIDKKDIPANITELFAKFTELMLGRWDEKKGFDKQYQAKIKDALLSEFAFDLHKRGDSTFKRAEFIDFATARLKKVNRAADIGTLVSEILDRSGLLRGDEEVQFRHHLLQEYFASKGIPNIDFIRDEVGNDWWRNSVVFYFGGRPDSVAQLLDVATSNSFEPAQSFIAVGLALQACYFSNTDEKIDVWKWVNGAASAGLVSDLLPCLDDKYPVSHFLAGYLEARDSLALTGIQDQEFDIAGWCSGDKALEEHRSFWYAVGLGELGEFELLEKFLIKETIRDPLLLTAVHIGCFFAEHMRELSSDKKLVVSRIVNKLNPLVESNRRKITEEFRGQLLEYRRGGVVALDEPEPTK